MLHDPMQIITYFRLLGTVLLLYYIIDTLKEMCLNLFHTIESKIKGAFFNF